ncbi:hypothetical protein H0H81_008741 [Sphagnurus paluster]|uniref:Pali-domain-containing protein n=1 Tax=Sphagnurus paluster TaxID=117069 RepID=A0A9P7GIS4_9AGAR|nr:hypothetical protein H0H81_008741 [Sphagnurus paluster]
MSRAFCIPGIVFLTLALVLNFLVSISLPYLPALDITRTNFGTSAVHTSDTRISEVRLGVWAPCFYNQQDQDRTCYKVAYAYNITFSDEQKSTEVTIHSSWTRGLAIHPVATGVTFVAFLLSFSTHITVTLVSSLISFLAAAITLIAFAVDIALFVYLRHQVHKLPDAKTTAHTTAAPGFWMTLAAFILLLLAGGTVCFGRRKERMANATVTPTEPEKKQPFWARFRKTKD